MTALTIHGWGAVTAVGLTSAATCAAVRAGVTGFREDPGGLPPAEPQIVAAVLANWRLRPRSDSWLVNLASRAVMESLHDEQPEPSRTALVLVPPEQFRSHPATVAQSGRSLITAIELRLRTKFHAESIVLNDGPAAVYRGLQLAKTLLADRSIQYCIVGGVDSLINPVDIARLQTAGRIKDDRNPQGLVPGEGACFLLVSATTQWNRFRPLGQVLGVGTAMESDTALGPKYSRGDGFRQALAMATSDAGRTEPEIDFVTSTFNGERYGAWESMIARPRFYRSRRDRLKIIYPAMSVGEIGTAAPALAIIVAATAIAREYAPGPIAMCESSSDEGLRAACLVGPSPEPPAFEKANRRAGRPK